MNTEKISTFIKSELKLRDKVLLVIIFCCLLALIAGAVLFLIPESHDVGALIVLTAQVMAEWIGLILFLFNGTIMQSKYWRYIIGGVMIILLSIIFKIMHLSGAPELLFSGFVLLVFVYTIRFINQSNKDIFSWFKYAWISSWCIVSVGGILNKISETYTLIPAILFWITLVFFFKKKMSVATEDKGD